MSSNDWWVLVAEAVHAGIQGTRHSRFTPKEAVLVELSSAESYQVCMMALTFFVRTHDLTFLSLPVDIGIAQCIAEKAPVMAGGEAPLDGHTTFFELVALVLACLGDSDKTKFGQRRISSAPDYSKHHPLYSPCANHTPVQLRIQFEELSLEGHSFRLYGSKPRNLRPSTTHVSHNGVLIPISAVCRQFRHSGQCSYGARCLYRHFDVEPHYQYSHNPYAAHCARSDSSSASADAEHN
eukprot:TRINITY_DN9360_c0_g1_i8.p1 TRINITY_DN9360_c0_g1~~TRINITY_DN9360_c0_g1_i8.p1  ORF type:complete len:238 (-),score=5.31 TRINITY_DN9360_c0_g1_i8:224-937(-)